MYKGKNNTKFLIYILLILICGNVFLTQQTAHAEIQQRKAGASNIADMISSRSKQITNYEGNRYKMAENKISIDPFGDNIKNYTIKGRAKSINGINVVKKELENYSGCKLSDKEIISIIFRSSLTGYVQSFTTEIRNSIPVSQRPTDKDELNACKKLTKCRTGGKDKNTNRSCTEIVEKAFKKGAVQQENKYKLEEANLGKDKYQNGTLEDSTYDLLYDLSVIASIYYESPKIASSLTFYSAPSGSSHSNNNSNSDNDPNNQPGQNNNQGTDNLGDNSGGNQNQQGNQPGETPSQQQADQTNEECNTCSTECFSCADSNYHLEQRNGNCVCIENQTTTPTPSSDKRNTPLVEDEEVEKKLNNEDDEYTTETSNGNPSFTNKCIVVTSPQLKEEYLKAENEPEDEPTELTSEDLERIADAFQKTTTAYIEGDETESVTIEDGDKIIENMTPSDTSEDPEKRANQVKEIIKELENCMDKCKEYSIDEKVVCEAKCLCTEIASPPLKEDQEYKILEEGALRIKVCTIPSKAVQVNTTTKTVRSIEAIINEIQNTLKSMQESGELTVQTKPKEELDTSLTKVKFGKTISFVLGLGKKSPTKKESKKAKKEKQKEIAKQTKDLFSVQTDSYSITTTNEQGNAESTKMELRFADAGNRESSNAIINNAVITALTKDEDYLSDLNEMLEAMRQTFINLQSKK